MPTSYHPAPTAANDPPAPVIKPADPDPEPTPLPRPWSVKPAAWLAILAEIRADADSGSWWRTWCRIHRRRKWSLPWGADLYHDLHAIWDRERHARGLPSMGPYDSEPAKAKEGGRR